MASALGGPSPFGAGGYGGFGSPFGASQPTFPAPGTPNTNSANPTSPTSPTNPTSATTSPTSAPSAGSPNPFLFGAPPPAAGGYNPALMQQMLAASHAMGQGGSAAGGWGGLGAAGYGLGSPPVPVPSDTRPPEERFQVQLQVSLFNSLPLFLLFYYLITDKYSFFFRGLIIATTRYGIRQRLTECSCSLGDGRKCSGCS